MGSQENARESTDSLAFSWILLEFSCRLRFRIRAGGRVSRNRSDPPLQEPTRTLLMVSEKTGRLPNIFLDRRLGLKPRSTQIAREFWGFWDSLAICGFTRRLCAQLRHSRKIFPTKSLCNPFSTCLEPSGDIIPSFYRLISSVCGFARELQENARELLDSLVFSCNSLAICGFTARLCAQLRHSRKNFPTKSL